MKRQIHAVAGTVALASIVTFWVSTFVSELFMSTASVVAVKNAILMAMWRLIPSMAAAGGSGHALVQGRKGWLFDVKKRRMQTAAANGLFILLPCAIALTRMANAGRFDTWFYLV